MDWRFFNPLMWPLFLTAWLTEKLWGDAEIAGLYPIVVVAFLEFAGLCVGAVLLFVRYVLKWH